LDVTLLSSGPVATQMRPKARGSIRRALTRLGVHLVEDATADRITDRAVILSDGRTVEFDSCLVALSLTAPDLARASGPSVDHVGRLCVDETLRCTDAPGIIGAGDAIVTPAVSAPTCARPARRRCRWADTRRDRPAPDPGARASSHLDRLRPAVLSQGRNDGHIQLVRPDDSARAGRLTGRKAAWVKERICRLVVDGPRKERRRPGAYRAAQGPRRLPSTAPR
jgi:NADH dehydrogenase